MAVGEENAAAAQQVAASTEETTTSTEQVSASASTLASDAEKCKATRTLSPVGGRGQLAVAVAGWPVVRTHGRTTAYPALHPRRRSTHRHSAGADPGHRLLPHPSRALSGRVPSPSGRVPLTASERGDTTVQAQGRGDTSTPTKPTPAAGDPSGVRRSGHLRLSPEGSSQAHTVRLGDRRLPVRRGALGLDKVVAQSHTPTQPPGRHHCEFAC